MTKYVSKYTGKEIDNLLDKVGAVPSNVATIKYVNDSLHFKQDTIPDMDKIREGALKGLTALQEIPEIPSMSEEEVDALIQSSLIVITDEIQDLQSRLDGEVVSWFEKGSPDLSNEMFSSWIKSYTDANNHVGDTYTDIDENSDSSGKSWRWVRANTSPTNGQYVSFEPTETELESTVYFFWQPITDSDAVKALELAGKAQAAADGKCTTFLTEDAPLNFRLGDIWILQKNTRVEGRIYPAGEVMIAYYNEGGDLVWGKKIRYTDDSKANEVAGIIENFINNEYPEALRSIRNQLDKKAETWYQTSDPSLTWKTEEYGSHIGDLWYCTNDYNNKYKKDTTWRWDWKDASKTEYEWKQQTIPKEVFDEIDGKANIFAFGDNDAVKNPTPPYNIGDIWVNAKYEAEYDGDLLRCFKSKGAGEEFAIDDWGLASLYIKEDAARAIAEEQLQNFFDTTYTKELDKIRKQLDQKAQTWYQGSHPSNEWTTPEKKQAHVGDLWYCTVDINDKYKKGTTWRWAEISEGTYEWQQQDVPKTVFDAIDGKAAIFVSKPESYNVNDMWILEEEYELSGKTYKEGTIVFATVKSDKFDASHWSKRDSYIDSNYVGDYVRDAISKIPTSEGAQYLVDVIKKGGTTTQEGGLFLTNVLGVGSSSEASTSNVTAGISGIVTENSNNTDVAFWAGGTFEEAYELASKFNGNSTPSIESISDSDIKFLVTQDGKIILNDAIIKGRIEATEGTFKNGIFDRVTINGIYNKQIDVIDETNYQRYTSHHNNSKYDLDVYNLGDIVIFDYSREGNTSIYPTQFILPHLEPCYDSTSNTVYYTGSPGVTFDSNGNIKGATLKDLRSIVGKKIIFYNPSGLGYNAAVQLYLGTYKNVTIPNTRLNKNQIYTDNPYSNEEGWLTDTTPAHVAKDSLLILTCCLGSKALEVTINGVEQLITCEMIYWTSQGFDQRIKDTDIADKYFWVEYTDEEGEPLIDEKYQCFTSSWEDYIDSLLNMPPYIFEKNGDYVQYNHDNYYYLYLNGSKVKTSDIIQHNSVYILKDE